MSTEDRQWFREPFTVDKEEDMSDPAISEEQIRAIAREESEKAVASLSGLVLRRLQEEHLTRSPDRNTMEDILDERLSEIFGEALQQFTDA